MTSTATNADTSSSTMRAQVHRLPRRVPAPATDPPYDDEHGGRHLRSHRTEGALALESRLAESTTRAPKLKLVSPKPLSRRVIDDETLFGRQPTPTAALPSAQRWAGQLGRALAEVMCGDRPVTQLMRWTDEAVYADVSRRATALTQAGAGRRGPRNRVSVVSVHVCEPRDGIAEAAVHIKHGHRSRALALRLEGLDGRWRCTALQLG